MGEFEFDINQYKMNLITYINFYRNHNITVIPAVFKDKCPCKGIPVAKLRDERFTPDSETVKKWFTKYGIFNLAIADKHVVEIDVDKPLPENLLKDFKKRTWVIRSGKGHKIIFRVKQPFTSTIILAEDPDIRIKGNVIVVPPSIHANGTQYRFEACEKLAEVEKAEDLIPIARKIAEAVGARLKEKLQIEELKDEETTNDVKNETKQILTASIKKINFKALPPCIRKAIEIRRKTVHEHEVNVFLRDFFMRLLNEDKRNDWETVFKLFEEISPKHEFDPEITKKQINYWFSKRYKPHNCENLKKEVPQLAGVCETCEYRGTVKNPLTAYYRAIKKHHKDPYTTFIRIPLNGGKEAWLRLRRVEKELFAAIIKDSKPITLEEKVKPTFFAEPKKLKKLFEPIAKEIGEDSFTQLLIELQPKIEAKIKALLKLPARCELTPNPLTVEAEAYEDALEMLEELQKERVAKFLERYDATDLDPEEIVEKAIEKDGKLNHAVFAEIITQIVPIRVVKETEQIAVYKEGIYNLDGEIEVKALIEELANALLVKDRLTRYFVEEVLGHIKRNSDLMVSIHDFNAYEGYICVENGILNVKTRELLPHSPEWLFLTKLPVKYDPDAKCPKIEQFLETVVPTDEMRRTLLKIIAYCLVPRQPLQKWFILVGSGSNGKSTYLRLLEAFLGKDNVSHVSLQDLETDKFMRSRLIGKLANIFPDLPNKPLKSTSFIKGYTGDDTLDVDIKFKPPVSLYPQAKLIFSANPPLPRVDDSSDGFWRRVVIVEFPFKFPVNRKFEEELTTPNELSGLLNLVLDALEWLKSEGFETAGVEELRHAWLRYSDPLLAFIHEHIQQVDTIVNDNPLAEFEPAYTLKDEIFEAYYKYCLIHNIPFRYKGVGSKAVFFKDFYEKLKAVGIDFKEIRPTIDGERKYALEGIRLVNLEKLDQNNETNDKEKKDETEPDETGETDNSPDSTNDTGNASNTDDVGFDISDALGLGDPREELLEEILSENEESTAETEETNEEKKSEFIKPLERPLKVWRDEDEMIDISDYAREVFAGLEKVTFNSEEEFERFLDSELEKLRENKNGSTIKYQTVKFYQNCPEFVGVDGQTYGPFKPGDVAKIPMDNIPPLVRGGFAKIISEGDST